MFSAPAYEEGQHPNEELRDYRTQGFFEKWVLGFQLEMSSALFFFQKELYKSAILETVLFASTSIPFVIFQVLAAIFFALYSVWDYFPVFGGVCEVIAILLLFAMICVSPLITDMYHRVSEKTEKMLDGEDVDPSSGPRVNGFCALFILVYVATGFVEFLILFPIALFCICWLIILPVGIAMLIVYSSFVRSWGSFKVVFLRHGLDYLGLLKFFFLTPEVIPFYMGMGTGNWCMRRVLRRFPGGTFLTHIVTVVSATRFYHFYKLNDCSLPETTRDRPPVAVTGGAMGGPVGGSDFVVDTHSSMENQVNYPAVVQQQPILPTDQQPMLPQGGEDGMKTDF